jgi:hypothetical protein
LSVHRKTYYISLPNGEIFQDRESSTWNFKIEASDDEIMQLRKYFNHNFSVDESNFYRAHLPYLEYHNDWQNDEYDVTLQKIYRMIYELGDQGAKQHIEKMGILQAKAMDDGLRY